MAGIRGQVREPQGGARARRNSQNLASTVSFIDVGSVITIDGDGYLQLTIGADTGLQNVSGSLGVKLATNPGLEFSTGLKINLRDTEPGLELAASGLGILLPASSGLEFSSGLKINLDGGTLALGVNGISVVTTALSPATITDLGVVLKGAAVADEATVASAGYVQTEAQAVINKVNELLGSLRAAGLIAT